MPPDGARPTARRAPPARGVERTRAPPLAPPARARGSVSPCWRRAPRRSAARRVRDVAWVATDASVTLPGTGVTPVNLAHRHVGTKVAVGSLPSALAYAPGGKDLLVVTQGDDQLHEIDAATHQVLHTVGVGVEPDAVAVAPGGQRRQGRGAGGEPRLEQRHAGRPRHLASGHADRRGIEPVAIAVSVAASGAATAFVADYGSNTVTPIDVATLQPGAAIPVGPGPADHRRRAGRGARGQLRQPDPHRDQPDDAAGGRHHCAPAQPDRHRRGAVGRHGLRLRGRSHRRRLPSPA